LRKISPGTRIVKLEENYRSTQNILNVANAVISLNDQEKEKEPLDREKKWRKWFVSAG